MLLNDDVVPLGLDEQYFRGSLDELDLLQHWLQLLLGEVQLVPVLMCVIG